jgi:hypothetical protein
VGGMWGTVEGKAKVSVWLATHSLSVEASIRIRAWGRPGAEHGREALGLCADPLLDQFDPSAIIQIWLALLWTSMPICSMAGLPFLRR